MSRAAAHGVAIAAAIAVLIAVSAAWIFHLRLGPRLDGLAAGPFAVALPFALLALTAAWLTIRALFGRWTRWGVNNVLGMSAIFAFVVTSAFCGPVACFAPGGNRLMGWFLVGGVALAGLAHHFVLARVGKDAGHHGR